ncbi:L,D-transpeptidase [Chelatococcus sambhunathii]|uniref:L,D-transpeptidase n=1 Tax=Chelatococcus sambhunathii TaxID=363953 RepID=A0ABU1DG37_9HYPH|nr:L,D-transpeptidase [Chelatococcus sambhunathii]MDR4307066.1 L,D-transpeptidase [Chelatococcus sambhunathii]
MVRAFALALAGGALALGLGGVPTSAQPLAAPSEIAAPREALPQAAQTYERYVDEDYGAPRRYGRRAYADDLFDDEGGAYYQDRRALPRRAPTVRRYRSAEDYEYEVEPRTYGRGRRYYSDREYEYESIDPEIRSAPRRLAGPPSALGASEGRRTVDPKFARTTVRYSGSEPANSIVIDTRTRYLYLVQGDGTAIRYGVGVGKEGFTWKGTNKISAKREWPDWYPPAEMRARRPELPEMMSGGPDNPLGARALYLGNTLYRIHGSNEPWTIGHAVSSGCIRMTNDDVIDLYERVNVGTTVKVI